MVLPQLSSGHEELTKVYTGTGATVEQSLLSPFQKTMSTVISTDCRAVMPWKPVEL